MKREPSTFSYIKVLEVGDSTSLPPEKSYAARCAVAYMEAEYEYSYDISPSTDGTMVTITRLS